MTDCSGHHNEHGARPTDLILCNVIHSNTINFMFPEPTLTVGNVIGVLKSVAVERRKEVWSRGDIVPHPQLEEIYQKYSTEEQRIHACADIYVNCCPHSSWTHLYQELYWANEMTAARKAKTSTPQTGEQ